MYAYDWIDHEFTLALTDRDSGRTLAEDCEGVASIRIYSHSEMDWLIDGITACDVAGERVELNSDSLFYKLIAEAIERQDKDEISAAVFARGRNAA